MAYLVMSESTVCGSINTIELIHTDSNGTRTLKRVFVYELSGCGFESRCCHLHFRYRACFEQEVH